MTEHGWYFAYGANMATRVLHRRELGHCKGQPAQLHGYRMEFTMPGLPLVEPAFATVVPDEDACVHGVLYRMSLEDLARLDGFETEQERFEVEVDGREAGTVRATTYRAMRHIRGRHPSRRYIGLLIEGAREHDLPEHWIRWIGDRHQVWIPLLSSFFVVYMRAFEIFARATKFHTLTTRLFVREVRDEEPPSEP